jgi:hypothetical protein
MQIHLSKIFKVSFLIFSIYNLLSCRNETEEIKTIKSIEFGQGQHLEVIKTDKNTTSYGILTNYNYGTRHQFSYDLKIGNDIEWKGGSQEPKEISIINGTYYLRYLHQQSHLKTEIDTVLQDTTTNVYYTIEEGFQKHIDKRYFFKWFGEDYWVNMDSSTYYSDIKQVEVYQIPNDNELILEINK